MWLLSVLAMHKSIALGMGVYLFAFIMIVLNLAAFGPGFAFPGKVANARRFGASEAV